MAVRSRSAIVLRADVVEEPRTMSRVRGRIWTLEEIELLQALVNKGVSPARASVVLKRPQVAVQYKAREAGTPFPDARLVKAARKARELSALDAIGRRRMIPEPPHG
jgi:hypothetical protein